MTKQNIFYHHIVPYLGEMKLDEITPKDIIYWQDQVMKDNNYKQTYLKTIHNQLSALFNYAVRFYGLKSNPARLAGNMGKEEVSEIKIDEKAMIISEDIYVSVTRDGYIKRISQRSMKASTNIPFGKKKMIFLFLYIMQIL